MLPPLCPDPPPSPRCCWHLYTVVSSILASSSSPLSLYLALDWGFVPLKLICWNLVPKGMVLEGLWEGDYVLRVEPSWIGTMPWRRDPREIPQHFHQARTQRAVGLLQTRKLHQTLNLPAPWSGLQPPELWEINICCYSRPVSGIFVTAAWTS